MARRKKTLGSSTAEHAAQAAHQLSQAENKQHAAGSMVKRGNCEAAVEYIIGAQSHRGSAAAEILSMARGPRQKSLQDDLNGVDARLANQLDYVSFQCVRKKPKGA